MENITNQKNYETDKRLWAVERAQLLKRLVELEGPEAAAKSKTSVSRLHGAGTKKEPEQTADEQLKDTMKVATDLRKQIDDMKKAYDEEMGQLRKQLEKTRQEGSKERTDLQRKLREFQENVKILEIDRRNMLSVKDDGEQEKTALQSEKDALMQKLHDSEIHQLANKYKLDKVADQVNPPL